MVNSSPCNWVINLALVAALAAFGNRAMGGENRDDQIPEDVRKKLESIDPKLVEQFAESMRLFRTNERLREEQRKAFRLDVKLLATPLFLGEPLRVVCQLTNTSDKPQVVPDGFARRYQGIGILERDVDPFGIVLAPVGKQVRPIAWLPGLPPQGTSPETKQLFLKPHERLGMTLELFWESDNCKPGKYRLLVTLPPLDESEQETEILPAHQEEGQHQAMQQGNIRFHAWVTSGNKAQYLFGKALPLTASTNMDWDHLPVEKPLTTEEELAAFGPLYEKEPFIQFLQRTAPESPLLKDPSRRKELEGMESRTISTTRAVYNRRLAEGSTITLHGIAGEPEHTRMVVLYALANSKQEGVPTKAQAYVALLEPFVGEVKREVVELPTEDAGTAPIKMEVQWPHKEDGAVVVKLNKGKWIGEYRFARSGK